MFYYCKSKTCTTCFLWPCLVNTIKSFKYVLLLFFRYTNTVIPNLKNNVIFLSKYWYPNISFRLVVSNSIITKIINNFLYHILICINYTAIFTLIQWNINIMLFCIHLKHFHTINRFICKTYFSFWHLTIHNIKFWKFNNIINQRQQS